jgi:hypothetical protein
VVGLAVASVVVSALLRALLVRSGYISLHGCILIIYRGIQMILDCVGSDYLVLQYIRVSI